MAVVGLLSGMMLAACSETDESASVTQKDETADTETAEDTEAKAEEGTRSNPIALHETATIEEEIYDDDFNEYDVTIDLSIKEVTRNVEAQQALKAMNEFNEDAPAPEGYEGVLVKAYGKSQMPKQRIIHSILIIS